jgi:hypothetical protein
MTMSGNDGACGGGGGGGVYGGGVGPTGGKNLGLQMSGHRVHSQSPSPQGDTQSHSRQIGSGIGHSAGHWK